MSSTSPARSPEKSNLPSDEQIETIPGVGLVRARCLRKAGFASVTELRSATVAQIAAVSGITAVKAQEIADYLRSNPPEAAAPVTATPATPADATPAPERVAPSPVQRVTEAAAALLGPDCAASLRPRLARQLRRWMDASAHLVADLKAGGKAAKQLAKAAASVEEIATGRAGGRKQQRDLAARLRSLRKRLRR